MPTSATETLAAALADRYTIERLIGEGGMATVYLARDVRHNRRVALKVLRPDLGAVVGVERFLAEIQVTANLQHPNLLPLFDSGTAGELLFYVMPYVQGESLRARLDREKQLPVDEAIRLATAIAAALDYAHRQGVIHRDLKPENVLLQEGQPLVADFGIALAVSNAGGTRITQTGLSLGTPHYMSPEQATGDRTVDGRTDIYSLGALAYEMLAGEPPHTGSTSQAIIARVLTERPRSIRASRPSVPEHVEAAVERALEKLPADRWPAAREFSEALTGARPMTRTMTRTKSLEGKPLPLSIARLREGAAWTVAAVGIAASLWYATRDEPRAAAAGRFVIELSDSVMFAPFATSTGRLSISRDGSRLAVVGRVPLNLTSPLYIRRSNDPALTLLRGTENGRSPAFSPNGEWVVFSTNDALRKVPSSGGTPETLVSTGDSADIGYSSWGDNGRILFMSNNRLFLVSENGGDVRHVATPDTVNRIYQLRQPHLLPGSRHALVSYVRGSRTANAAPDSVRLGVISIEDGSLEDLGVQGAEPQFVAPDHVVYNRGAVVFAAPFSLRSRRFTGPPARLLEGVAGVNPVTSDFAVAQNGWLTYVAGREATATTMWIVGMNGTGRQLRTDSRFFVDAAISPDGNRIVANVQTGALDNIWVYDVSSGALTPITTRTSYRPAWSRDGTRVFYLYVVAGDSIGLASKPWDGSGTETIHGSYVRLNEFAEGVAHGWSVFRANAQRDLFIAPTDSLTAIKPFVTTASNESEPAISPNGRWVAFQSDASGRNEVIVRPLPGPGAAVQLSVDGGVQPRWSPDGKVVYFRSPTHMLAARITETPQLAVIRRDTIFVDNFARGVGFGFDVFPDGRQFLMLRGGDTQARLFMVVNWRQLIGTSSSSRADR